MSGGRRMSPVVGGILVLAIAAATAVAVAGVRRPQERFPHREHAGLFPYCTGCHAGVPSGDRSAVYPPAELCSRCHDGRDLERVEWTPSYEEAPDNLRFTHPDHLEATRGDSTPGCRDCHSPAGAPRMEVSAAEPARCLSCHAHEAEEHLADARCVTCHRPLAETRFSLAAIRGLPSPPSHDRRGFVEEVHGELAEESVETCATCHTRERCASCHVNAEALGPVTSLAVAPEGMELPTVTPAYPTPQSHLAPDWLESHGEMASPESCSTCHTRQGCASCHAEPAPRAVGALPDRERVAAPGVRTTRREPSSHESPFFPTEHGVLAATEPGSCTTCHTEARCTGCHTDERQNEYHPADFMARHSTDAYNSQLECANCHDLTVFCQECHGQLGMGSSGRLGPGFHDGQPQWLFRHGQPARQSLESCASCHTQRDCLQCHSVTGSFKVSPHGPGFDPEQYASKNRAICFACHLSDPLGGGGS